MAIMIIDGVPGAGKTYYAVKHLLDTYFIKDKTGNYEKKEPVKIITNIDGFQLDHLNLDDVVKASGGVKVFFSKDFQEKVFEKHGPVVYVIDEAQMIFDRKFYDREVFSWFEYHRHFGQNIYLITQAAAKLPRDVTCLIEYVIRALPRSGSITGREFRYAHVQGKEVLRHDTALIKKEIFGIYKSASAEEVEKPKNPIMRRMVLIFIGCMIAFYCSWQYILNSWGGHDSEAIASINKSQSIDSLERKNRTLSSGSRSTFSDSASLSGKSAQKNDIPPYEPDLIPHELNYLAIMKEGVRSITILFNGRQYRLRDFPYEVDVRGTDLIAMIPQGDYYAYFPQGKPERKYYTPPNVEEKRPRRERPERNEQAFLTP